VPLNFDASICSGFCDDTKFIEPDAAGAALEAAGAGVDVAAGGLAVEPLVPVFGACANAVDSISALIAVPRTSFFMMSASM